MILYVITQSYPHYLNAVWFKGRTVLEQVARDACVALHYSQVSLDLARRLRPWAICHSGGSTSFADVLSCQAYIHLIKEWEGPQLGICLGHQVMALAWGSQAGPIRRLRPDEPDPADYGPGWFKEWGLCTVRVLRSDPLFRGCAPTLRVQQRHYCHITRLARCLRRLARSRECAVQAFRHADKPMYGVQFHPEMPPDKLTPDGRRILDNFFRLARPWRRTLEA